MAAKRLVQLHWQDRANPDRTEFVGQGEFDDADDMAGWANELISRRAGECPEGWCPLVMTEGHPRFVTAAEEKL